MCCDSDTLHPGPFHRKNSEVEVSRDVEAVIWFFGAFCSCLPKDQTAATAAEAASHAATRKRFGMSLYNVFLSWNWNTHIFYALSLLLQVPVGNMW